MSHAARASEREGRYREAAAQFGAALERLARAYEPDAESWRDLLQDIHVALWRSFARFDGRCSLRTWVYRVAHNTATSKILRAKSRTPAFVTLDEAFASTPVPARAEAELDRQRALDRLRALIRRLAPLDRQVILLYLEELDAKAIGEITGLSAANVATKVARIKKMLAGWFSESTRHDE